MHTRGDGISNIVSYSYESSVNPTHRFVHGEWGEAMYVVSHSSKNNAI